MTALSFFGNLLTAFGPFLALLVVWLQREGELMSLLLLGSFGSITTLLLMGLARLLLEVGVGRDSAVPPVAHVLVGVTIQELGRMGLFFAFRHLNDRALHLYQERKGARDQLAMWTALGLGFGVSASFCQYVPQLVSSYGPGGLFCPACPEGLDLYFVSALTANVFTWLHALWMALTWQACSGINPRSVDRWTWLGVGVASHYAAALSTLWNVGGSGGVGGRMGCVYSLLVCHAILAGLAVRVLGGLRHVKGD